jgi:hypothetical protein
MHARTRTCGRAPAALLPLCLCLSSACSDDPEPPTGPDAAPPELEIPLGASLPPLAYTLTLTYTEPPGGVERPASISGHLYLDVAADGQVTGVYSASDPERAWADIVEGRVEGTEILVASDRAVLVSGGQLTVDELRIALLDRDGDGTADGAKGEASGSWLTIIGGDIVSSHSFTADATASLDTAATTAFVFVLRDHPEILPFDPVIVHFQEPLREADVRDNLRILASGTALTGELTLTPTAGLVTGARFQPDAFLAFDAEVTVDLGALQDPSGNALTASAARAPVMADPGAFTANAGFESGLDGWLVLGEASTQGQFQGLAPVEGAAQAVVGDTSMLVTYLDVPADATEIDLSVTVLHEQPEVFPDHTVITLRRPGVEPIEIFDAGDFADQLQPCPACTDFGAVLGPVRRTLDLTPYRGQRVFLTVEVGGLAVPFGNDVAVLLDDIQVR